MSDGVRGHLALLLILASVRGSRTLADLSPVPNTAGGIEGSSIEAALDLLGFDTADQAIEGLLAQVPAREALILDRRVLRLTNLAKQEELAREIGLTRQRVHQMEGPVRDRWWASAAEDESLQLYVQAWLSALPDAIPTDELVARHGDRAEAVVVTLSALSHRAVTGPWSVAERAAMAWEAFSKQLANAADEQAYIEMEELLGWTEGLSISPEHVLRRAADFSGERFQEGLLFRPTRRTRALTALRLSDRPLTVDEIADLAGASEGYVGNILAEADEVVRADKQRFWMRDRVADPYEGIVQEIRQRIEASGGVASVDQILRELPATFGVAECSVRSYVYGKLFTVDGDAVREGTAYRFEPKDPRLLKNVRRTEDGWAERVTVKDEHLRGYSLALSPHVCFANGVRPSDSLRVPIEGSDEMASVIWNTANITGRVDVGRLRSTLTARGIQAEATIWIAASPRGVSVTQDAAADSASTNTTTRLEDLKELVGIDPADELPANPLLARLRARRT